MGLILNAKNLPGERETVEAAALEMNTSIIEYIPRCEDIQRAEDRGGTVFQYVPESSMLNVYNHLADTVIGLSSGS
jgi:nitrogenase iron protein NifH